MPIAQGVSKQLRVKRQTAKGTIAIGTSGGQILRRKTSTFELSKETYTTADEISSSQQIKSSRHGVKVINGAIDALLSPGTYADILSTVVRRDFAAVTNITGASITIAGTAGANTLTRATGSFLTDGIKVGMIVRLTAGTFNVANSNNNLLVTAVTATILTVTTLNGSLLVNEGPITGATVAVPGKVTYVPDTGHTNIYYTVEEWYPDASPAVSERNVDVKFIQADLSMPGSGNAGIKFTANGLDQQSGTTAYFTSPTAESSSDTLTAAGGVLLVNGAAVATVTDLSVSINGNGKPADGVVGTNLRPDVFTGKVAVSGSFTAYFEGGAIPDLFRNETQTSIVSAMLNGSSNTADFMTVAMSNVRLNSSSPDDTETGLKRTYQFVAIYNAAGGAALANHATSIQLQDSLA